MVNKTAGIVIVGDELLKGQVVDTNSTYACRRFRAAGVRVLKIVVVADAVDEIAAEVSRFSSAYDLVMTSGGVGPTHDDATYEGVAKALSDDLLMHEELAAFIKHAFKLDDGSAAFKMAVIPSTGKLVYVTHKNGDFPVVQAGNVFILPGVPRFFQMAVDHLVQTLRDPEVQFFTMNLVLRTNERNIVDALNEAVAKYEGSVSFGSYPILQPGVRATTKIVLESTDLDHVTAAYTYLTSSIPHGYQQPGLQPADVDNLNALMEGCSGFAENVRGAVKVVEEALRRYQDAELSISFNGGKDCTVLLHLIWAMRSRVCHNSKLNAIYVRPEDQFPEVDHFIRTTTQRYGLDLVTVNYPMKKGLQEVVTGAPMLKAVFIGTRRSDPYSESLQPFLMCDADWPQVMRVHPMLDWSYSDIWTFLRLLSVPYCSLYDEGYTSLGSIKNTRQNPALQASGSGQYLPAYRLQDPALERQGRS